MHIVSAIHLTSFQTPALSTQVVQQTQTSESSAQEEKTEVLVRSTLCQLHAHYKANGNRPINYFKFVMDPRSFGNTVENAFHVSFLVKEKQARISEMKCEGVHY